MRRYCYLMTLLITMLALAGCSEATFLDTFDSNAWDVDEYPGVHSAIVDERLQLTVDYPDSMFFMTAGRSNYDNGRYSVEVEAVDGSVESAYGIIFRATPNATDFYYFLISVDGFYSIGGCQNGCKDGNFVRVGDNMWSSSAAITPGLGQRHLLAVEAIGDNLTYYINDVEVGSYTNPNFIKGDLGILVQTFDSAATVAFDNLAFTPAENEAATESP